MTEWKINGNPACLQVLAWRMGKTMNVLMVGDVVGPGGCQFLQERLYRLKKEYAIDVTIVNGENSAKGNDITANNKIFNFITLSLLTIFNLSRW